MKTNLALRTTLALLAGVLISNHSLVAQNHEPQQVTNRIVEQTYNPFVKSRSRLNEAPIQVIEQKNTQLQNTPLQSRQRQPILQQEFSAQHNQRAPQRQQPVVTNRSSTRQTSNPFNSIQQKSSTEAPTYVLPFAQAQTKTTVDGVDYQANAGIGLDVRKDVAIGASVDSNGDKFIGAKAKVGAGVYADAGASQSGKIGKVDVSNHVEGEAFLGTEAEAEAGLTQDGLAVGAKGFSGARATGNIGTDVGPVGYGATGEVWAGAGVEAGVKAGFEDGKFSFGGELGAGLGVGGKVGLEGSVDVGAIGDGVVTAAEWSKDRGQDVGNWTKERGQDVGNWTKDRTQDVGNAARNAGDWTKQAGQDVGNWTQQRGRDVGNWTQQRGQDVGNAARSAGNWTKQAGQDVGNWTQQRGRDVGNAARNVGNGVKKAAQSAGNGVKNTASKAAKGVSKGFNKAKKGIGKLFGK